MDILNLAAAAGVVTLGISLLLYLLPAFVAGWRDHHNLVAIVVLNILLGWTVIGWILALVWSCTSPPPQRRS